MGFSSTVTDENLQKGSYSDETEKNEVRKKILVERNKLDDACVKSTMKMDLSPKISRSLTSSSESQPSPPRPKFLRYNPDRSRDILLRLQQATEARTTSCLVELESENSENPDEKIEEEEEEEEEEDEEEDGCTLKGFVKLLCWIVLLLFSTSYLWNINSSSTLLPVGGSESHLRNDNLTYEGDKWKSFGDRRNFFGLMGDDKEVLLVAQSSGQLKSSEIVGDLAVLSEDAHDNESTESRKEEISLLAEKILHQSGENPLDDFDPLSAVVLNPEVQESKEEILGGMETSFGDESKDSLEKVIVLLDEEILDRPSAPSGSPLDDFDSPSGLFLSSEELIAAAGPELKCQDENDDSLVETVLLDEKVLGPPSVLSGSSSDYFDHPFAREFSLEVESSREEAAANVGFERDSYMLPMWLNKTILKAVIGFSILSLILVLYSRMLKKTTVLRSNPAATEAKQNLGETQDKENKSKNICDSPAFPSVGESQTKSYNIRTPTSELLQEFELPPVVSNSTRHMIRGHSSRHLPEEPHTSSYAIRAPTVELLGEVEFGQVISSSKQKVVEKRKSIVSGKENSYSEPLVKLQSPSASFEFSSSDSWSCAAQSTIAKNENATRDQAPKAFPTPVRGSSRIQSRGIQSPYPGSTARTCR